MASKTTVDTVQTKWGTLVTFNGHNWIDFYEAIRTAMIAASALSLCTGRSVRPASGRADIVEWDRKAGIAFSIINSCIIPMYRSQLMHTIDAEDIAGTWAKLLTFNNNANLQHAQNLRQHITLYA
ncbi:hypothetical protein DID88_009458 [Monilinia fructigena]|uniref:Uncharacterized protein n=1 Tax=Monilinia fructigena TaxID=38457 RepID=A0A395ILU0_9HELO|nr:hypothetical protein DID88_009458 [Monilinia fructigena]